MKKCLLLLLLLTGCSSMGVCPEPVERLPLKLSGPPPIKLAKVELVVIHKDNAEAIFADLVNRGIEPVVFALTGNDYKALATNISDIKDYIILQRKIIRSYQQYYEDKK